MNHYFIANIRINNQDEYQKYLDKVDEVFDKYNGEYLAVDESPVILEGKWNFTKSVLIKFNNRKDFDDENITESPVDFLQLRQQFSLLGSNKPVNHIQKEL